MDDLINVLSKLRIGLTIEEQLIHNEIKDLFDKENIIYNYEYKLGKGSRVDFFCPDRKIAIEVKKGKPNDKQLGKQLERYASFEEVEGLIIVSERYVKVPSKINNKDTGLIVLHKLWF